MDENGRKRKWKKKKMEKIINNKKSITKSRKKSLIKERYPESKLFICDVADAILKDIMAHMEHPFYSLSKKPEKSVRRYEHNGNWLEIVPSVKGLATIYDKDILIYCISQLINRKNRGEEISRKVRIIARDLLTFTNRGTSGKDYASLCEALDRLDGTRIRTNICREGEEIFNAFGLIDSAAIARKFGFDGRLLWCEVTLSEWVFDALDRQKVLTLHRDYFRLRKPLERRVYEIARKHCGHQNQWIVKLDLLWKKSGSKSPLKHFRYLIKELARNDHLPDYHVIYKEEHDYVIFNNREVIRFNKQPINKQKNEAVGNKAIADEAIADKAIGSEIYEEIYEKARKIAPRWDVKALEREWRSWISEPPRNAGAAFLGFCRKWVKFRGKG